MGIFDKVLGTGNDKLTETDGFTGVILAAVAADGVITPEEQVGLYTSISRMKLYQGMSDRQFSKSVEKLVGIVKSEGVDGLVAKSAAAVPGDLRATAFAVATDLLFADGNVAPEERRFLEKIQKALGVADDLAMKIVEVIQVKNRG